MQAEEYGAERVQTTAERARREGDAFRVETQDGVSIALASGGAERFDTIAATAMYNLLRERD